MVATVSALMLLKPVCNVIIVALGSDEHVRFSFRARRSIKCTHGDTNPVSVHGLPKHRRPAYSTKTTPDLLRRKVPNKVGLAINFKVRFWDVRRGKHVPRLFAALCAMAKSRKGKVAVNNEPNRATHT